MIISAYILLFVTLLFIAFQDLQHREVSVWLFPLLAVASTLFFFSQKDGVWQNIVMNILFVTVLISCLFLYISIKHLKVVNIFKAHFGLGDVLFLTAITPMFSISNMVIYVIFGMVFAILIHLLAQSFKRLSALETVPLAGYLSIFLTCILVADVFFSPSLFYTDLLI